MYHRQRSYTGCDSVTSPRRTWSLKCHLLQTHVALDDVSFQLCIPAVGECASATDFLCADGYCVPDYARCDAKSDCQDKSDEADCVPTAVSEEAHCDPTAVSEEAHCDPTAVSDEAHCVPQW